MPAIALSRSFTIDPLFAVSQDPLLRRTRDYPTWIWQIPPRKRKAELVRSVNAADDTLRRGGYCGPDDRCAYFLTMLCFVAPNCQPKFIEEWTDGQFCLSGTAEMEQEHDFARCFIPTGHTDTLDRLDHSTRTDLSDVRKAIRSFALQWPSL